MDKCQYRHLSYKAFVFRGICLLTVFGLCSTMKETESEVFLINCIMGNWQGVLGWMDGEIYQAPNPNYWAPVKGAFLWRIHNQIKADIHSSLYL